MSDAKKAKMDTTFLESEAKLERSLHASSPDLEIVVKVDEKSENKAFSNSGSDNSSKYSTTQEEMLKSIPDLIPSIGSASVDLAEEKIMEPGLKLKSVHLMNKLAFCGTGTNKSFEAIFSLNFEDLPTNAIPKIFMSLVLNDDLWYDAFLYFPKPSEENEDIEQSFLKEYFYGDCFVRLKFLNKDENAIGFHHFNFTPTWNWNSKSLSDSSEICLKSGKSNNGTNISCQSKRVIDLNFLDSNHCIINKSLEEQSENPDKGEIEIVKVSLVQVEVDMVFIRKDNSPKVLSSKFLDIDLETPACEWEKEAEKEAIERKLEEPHIETNKVQSRILCDSGTITVSKKVLCDYSPVFALLFEESEFNQKEKLEIPAEYITQTSFEKLKNYLQSQNSENWLENVELNLEIFEFAEAYLLPELLGTCMRNFMEIPDELYGFCTSLSIQIIGRKYGLENLTQKGIRAMDRVVLQDEKLSNMEF